MVFQATARSALLRMRSIESPGGDGHPGDPTVCAYHVMVEEPTVHGLSGRVVDVHGNPLQGITVRAWEESGLSPEATPSPCRRLFAILVLLAGVFRVEATGTGYSPPSTQVGGRCGSGCRCAGRRCLRRGWPYKRRLRWSVGGR